MATQVKALSGTVVSISASLPATEDAAGYEALTFTKIGEVSNVGAVNRTWTEVDWNNIETRGTSTAKGSFKYNRFTLEVGVIDDAGQAIAEAAEESDDPVSYKVEYPAGDIRYFSGMVMQFGDNGGGIDDIRAATLDVQPSPTGHVHVAAPSA